MKNVSEEFDRTPQTTRVIPIDNPEIIFLSPIRQPKQITLEAGIWKRLAEPKSYSQIIKSRKSVKQIPVKLEKIPCISPRLEIYQKLNSVREDEKEEEKLLKHIESEIKDRRHSRIDKNLEKIQTEYFSPINRRNRIFESSIHEKKKIEEAKERSEIILEEKKKKCIERMNRWEIRRKLKEQKERKLNNKRKLHTFSIIIQIINKFKYLKDIYIPYYNSIPKHSKLFYHTREVIWNILIPQIRRRKTLLTCIDDVNEASSLLEEFLKRRKIYIKVYFLMKIYLRQCIKVKNILIQNYEIVKAKKELLYLIWNKVENQVLKQYNSQKAQELKAVKERMMSNHINVSNNVKITRITKLPDKYKLKYCGIFLTDIRQHNYIETKTANRYTNYIATENDIKDIFLDPDETKVKEISKRLVAKPQLKYNHYFLIKKAKMKNGIRDFVVQSLNEFLAEEDERKSEILSARNSMIKQNSSEKNINSLFTRRTSKIISEPRH